MAWRTLLYPTCHGPLTLPRQSAPLPREVNFQVSSEPICFPADQVIVGMMNSAPDRMPVGQREVTVFSLV
jgi:hypothetical protein